MTQQHPYKAARFIALLTLLLVSSAIHAQPNYDEALVPVYTLPDPLIMNDGAPVREAAQWPKRRAEILELFETHVYGRTPRHELDNIRFNVMSTESALDGKAIRKQVEVLFTGASDGPRMEILIYLPRGHDGPVPTFLLLNFHGNHTIHDDPGIHLSTAWMRNRDGMGIEDHRATEASRGRSSGSYPVEAILERGYGLATIYCGDLTPDHAQGLRSGIHPLFGTDDPDNRANDAWGAIGAWAWGLSRAMDYFERDADIDHNRVAVLGHSRLGKTSLWAGAQDERFAIVISNNSGCGGAALSRRRFGETVERINTHFPHWFCTNFRQYNDNEDALPVDQHMLIALVAPRPVYVASATEDRWADPRGEFLAALHAEPVYELLGQSGLGVRDLPPADEPVGHTIGYHLRTGRHALLEYDWLRYMDFADRHFNRP